ncbi:MAG: CcmD family protein [Clostridiales bacterium]|nr:CcmD family protein [Clostridiales bacterium]
MTYLVAGYLVIWTLIFGYTLLLGRRLSEAEKRIARLEKEGKGRS